MTMNQKSTIRNGFTLIETLVAVSVISIGFVGALVLLAKSASQASILRQRVTGARLAEEGLEVVRNIRDSNWLRNLGWRDGLADTGASVALVNYNSLSLDTSPSAASRDCLNYSGGFYVHPAAIESCNTPFKRHIELTTGPADPDLRGAQPLIVASVVSWPEKAQTQTITVLDYLYDWK